MGPHTTIIASGASIASAAALFGTARLAAWRARVYGTCLVLLFTCAVMLAQPFKPHAVGDYSLFTRSRSLFEDRFSTVIAFQYHLAGVTIHLLDEAFGKTAESPHEAFHTLARLASFAFLLGLLLFALQQRFSERVVRYLAIVAAAPPTLLLFGYHEFGYLPDVLIVSALPLALVGLEEEKSHFVVAAAVLLGVGAALHGFGLVAAVFLLLTALVWETKHPRRMRARVAQIVGGVSFGWLSWLALYFIFGRFTVEPGHAAEFPLRPLFHTRVDEAKHRYDYAIFSGTGLRDIFFEFVILGIFVALFLLFSSRGDRLGRAVAAATAPVILFVILFWPVQGLGNDTDFLGSAFPSLYASGWLASRSQRLSLIAVAALCISQAALLWVVHDVAFTHSRDF